MRARKPANSIDFLHHALRPTLARLMRATFAVGLIAIFGSAAPAPKLTGDAPASTVFDSMSSLVVRIADIPQADSHGEDNCGHCEDFKTDEGWVHQAMEYLLPRTGSGPGRDEDPQWHPDELKPGQCFWVHGLCTHGEGTEEYAAGELRTAVAAAAAQRDVATLARLVDLPGVAVVPERTAIQVIGCDGETVVGHVPVERAVLIGLQAVRSDLDR